MAKIRSVKFNFFMNFILTASNFLFPLITFPYVSRILLADGTGKIAFATSVAGYFSMVASLGIPTYGIRACAKVRDDKEKLSKLSQELLIIHSITTLISCMAFFVAIFTVDKLEHEKMLMIINAFSILLNVLGANWLYSALEQYAYITIRSLFFKVISIILMFVFIHEKSDYIIYGIIGIFATAGSNILNFVNLRKFISFKKFKNYEFIIHMRPILIFFAQSVAVTVYTNLDTVMLGFITNNFQVGYYNAAIKIKSILLSLVTSLGVVLLPRLSYYIQNNLKNEFENLINKALEIVLLTSIPLSIYFVIFSRESLLFLSGEGFIGATLAMQIITPTIFFIGLTNVLGMQILTPMGKEKYVVFSVVVGATVDLILNIIFIPLLGAAGAALGTLVAEISVFIVQLYYLRHMIFKVMREVPYKKIFICNFIALIAVTLCKFINFSHVFFELVVTACLFFGAYGISLIILKESMVYEYFNKAINYIKKVREMM